MDRLESMAVFVEVVKAGSLAAAAERLGISASMVAKHLRALETRLQVRLLQRTTRSQKLTEAGALFLERCQEILRQVDAAEDDTSSLRGEAAGLLRISAPSSFGVTRLAPALAAFRQAHPKVTIDLALTDEAIDPIGDGVDLAFRIGPLPESALIARPLAQFYRMIVCAAPAYLDRHGVPAAPQELAGHDCLGHTRWGPRHQWSFKSGEETFEVPIRYKLRLDNGLAIREAAIAGAGIILQPHALVEDALSSGLLRQLLTDHETRGRQLYLVYPKDRAAPAKLRAFVEFALLQFS